MEKPELTLRGVKNLQKKLKPYNLNIIPDGSIGNETKKGILAFQQKAGLPETGEFDSETVEALEKS